MKHQIIKFEPDALDRFQKISAKKWWEMFGRQGAHYYTVDHGKYAETLYNLARLKRASEYVAGRFVAELIEQIQREADEWDTKFYKDPAKRPEYLSARKWFDDHQQETGISWKTAGRYLWTYQNVDPEFSGLGYRKNRAVEDFLGSDGEYKKKFRRLIRERGLNEVEVEKTLEVFVDRVSEEAREAGVTESSYLTRVKAGIFREIERLGNKGIRKDIEVRGVRSEGSAVIIECGSAKDAARIRDAVVAMEPQIRLRAGKLKK